MPKKSDISKTKRADYSEADILSAVKRVVEDDGAKIRAVALEFNIDRMTLTRYVKKFQNGELKSQFRYWGNRSVFTEEEEVALSEYLQTSCKMYFGLARKEVMKLAYEYGDKIKRQMPINWNANCSAGKDWFQGFMRRHPEISLRTPEATSIARASSFNPTNVGMFFDLLESVKSRYNFEAKDIYNVDETGCITVQKTGKVVAPTGLKQVSVKHVCAIKSKYEMGKLEVHK
jgi:transposase-like protein